MPHQLANRISQIWNLLRCNGTTVVTNMRPDFQTFKEVLMKFFLPVLCLLPFSAFAQISPLKHSIDPTCQYQVAKAVIEETRETYGTTYQTLTPGLLVEVYAKLESFPTISLTKSVITIKNRSSGVKSEVYFKGRSGSTGLASNGQPLHRCNVTIEQIAQSEYEALK
jgi:hypothetical protein